MRVPRGPQTLNHADLHLLLQKRCAVPARRARNGPSHHWQEVKVFWLSISAVCGAFRPDRRSAAQGLLNPLRAC